MPGTGSKRSAMNGRSGGIGGDPACDERAPARLRQLWKAIGDKLVSQSTTGNLHLSPVFRVGQNEALWRCLVVSYSKS